MKNAPSDKDKPAASEEMRDEYEFDYSQAKPNRFASRVDKTRLVVALDPDEQSNLFSAPAKWEQNRLTHSFGTLIVDRESISFEPGKVSVLATAFTIPLQLVSAATKRDNFLFRGAVTIHLSESLHGRKKYIFFLGSKFREFLTLTSQLTQ